MSQASVVLWLGWICVGVVGGEQGGLHRVRVRAFAEYLCWGSNYSCSEQGDDSVQVTVTEALGAERSIVVVEILCPYQENRDMTGYCMLDRYMTLVGGVSYRRHSRMRNSSLVALFVTRSRRRPADLPVAGAAHSLRATTSD